MGDKSHSKLSGSYNLSTPFSTMTSEPMCGSFEDVSTGPRLQSSALSLVVVFCNGLYLLQRERFLDKGEDYPHLWAQGQIFRVYLRIR